MPGNLSEERKELTRMVVRMVNNPSSPPTGRQHLSGMHRDTQQTLPQQLTRRNFTSTLSAKPTGSTRQRAIIYPELLIADNQGNSQKKEPPESNEGSPQLLSQTSTQVLSVPSSPTLTHNDACLSWRSNSSTSTKRQFRETSELTPCARGASLFSSSFVAGPEPQRAITIAGSRVQNSPKYGSVFNKQSDDSRSEGVSLRLDESNTPELSMEESTTSPKRRQSM